MFTNHWEPSLSRTDIPVVVSEERYADEGGERVGELFGQSFAVILRKRSSSPPKSAASAAQATSACFGAALGEPLMRMAKFGAVMPLAFVAWMRSRQRT